MNLDNDATKKLEQLARIKKSAMYAEYERKIKPAMKVIHDFAQKYSGRVAVLMAVRALVTDKDCMKVQAWLGPKGMPEAFDVEIAGQFVIDGSEQLAQEFLDFMAEKKYKSALEKVREEKEKQDKANLN